MRNHGIAFGYSIVGYKSLLKGLDKIEVNNTKIEEDLNAVNYLFICLLLLLF